MRNSFAKQTAFRRIDGIARGLERHGSRVMEVLFLRNFGRSQMDRFPAETSEKPETFTRTCSIFRTFPYSLGGIAPLSPSGDINFIVPPPPMFSYIIVPRSIRGKARERMNILWELSNAERIFLRNIRSGRRDRIFTNFNPHTNRSSRSHASCHRSSDGETVSSRVHK